MDRIQRFIEIYSQGLFLCTKIILDTQTGVNYIFHQSGYGGGLSPLLGPDGSPVVTPMGSIPALIKRYGKKGKL